MSEYLRWSLQRKKEFLIESAFDGNLSTVIDLVEALGFHASCHINYYCSKSPTVANRVPVAMTALRAAASNGHLQIVHYLCDAAANPYLPYDKLSPRELALKNGHVHVANYLKEIMKLPKWLNEIDATTGYTPLTGAIAANLSVKAVRSIIYFGADVCKSDSHKKTPLMYAIQTNSTEIIQKLLEKGAIASGVSAAKHAIELRTNDSLKVLLNTTGMLLDVVFDDGFTMLTKSITWNNAEIARCLIEKGVDFRKVDGNNNVPIEKALEMNDTKIAELLAKKGAKVPKTIATSLFEKLASNGNVEMYKFLLKHGWDVNQLDENGNSSLKLSASKWHLHLTRFLIEMGAKIEVALPEIEAFRKESMDFDCFMTKILAENDEMVKEKLAWNPTGQE